MGALRRTHRRAVGGRGALRAAVAAAFVTAVVVAAHLGASAHARPQLFGPVAGPCPEAVLPLRMATFQAAPNETLDVEAWLALDEFAWSRAWVSLDRDASPISIAVLAYVGSLATTMTLEIAHPEGEVTWSRDVELDPPSAGRTTLTFYPYYAVVEIPRSEWDAAFPQTGLYVLRAFRGPEPAITHLDGPCEAEARSWVLVVR